MRSLSLSNQCVLLDSLRSQQSHAQRDSIGTTAAAAASRRTHHHHQHHRRDDVDLVDDEDASHGRESRSAVHYTMDATFQDGQRRFASVYKLFDQDLRANGR